MKKRFATEPDSFQALPIHSKGFQSFVKIPLGNNIVDLIMTVQHARLTSRSGYGVKFASTTKSPFSGTVSVHVIPLHEPLNPVNVNPALGVAIKRTVEPTGNTARQMPLFTRFTIEQATPPGVLETEPLPAPLPAMIVTEPGTARRYNACTFRDCNIVS